MTSIVNVKQTFTVDGEVVKEQTFPITGLREVEQVGCLPIKIEGYGYSELEVTFTFEPPLLIPGARQPQKGA